MRYKRVVSCKAYFHRTDLLAVSVHAPRLTVWMSSVRPPDVANVFAQEQRFSRKRTFLRLNVVNPVFATQAEEQPEEFSPYGVTSET